MPLLASILALVSERTGRTIASARDRVRDAARTRREHTILREFDAMNDDRLYDLGLSRDAIRCGLHARHRPLAAARACGTEPVGGLNSRRWGDPLAHDRVQTFRREEYLGW